MIFAKRYLVLNYANAGCVVAITIMCATSELENALSHCLVEALNQQIQ